MRRILRIAQAGAAKKAAQDAPGTIFSRGGATLVSPLFEQAYPQRSLSCLNVIEHFRAVEDDVDAAVPEDAKNAPPRDLENCKDRSFPQRPHRSFFLGGRKKNGRTNDLNSVTKPSTKSDQGHLCKNDERQGRRRRRRNSLASAATLPDTISPRLSGRFSNVPQWPHFNVR